MSGRPASKSSLHNRGRVEIGRCPIDLLTMDELVQMVEDVIGSRGHIRHAVVDAAQLAQMRANPELQSHVVANDVINADGQTVVWLSRLGKTPIPERITGIDLFQRLVALAAERGYRIFILGAKQETVAKVAEGLSRTYSPDLIAGWRSGYFGREEESDVVESVVSSGADMLFVGLPTPMEERFLYQNRERLEKIPFVTGLGGGLEFAAGDVRRAPLWMQKAGLEWLHRFAQEPRRKWKSEVVDASSFYFGLVADRLRRRD